MSQIETQLLIQVLKTQSFDTAKLELFRILFPFTKLNLQELIELVFPLSYNENFKLAYLTNALPSLLNNKSTSSPLTWGLVAKWAKESFKSDSNIFEFLKLLESSKLFNAQIYAYDELKVVKDIFFNYYTYFDYIKTRISPGLALAQEAEEKEKKAKEMDEQKLSRKRTQQLLDATAVAFGYSSNNDATLATSGAAGNTNSSKLSKAIAKINSSTSKRSKFNDEDETKDKAKGEIKVKHHLPRDYSESISFDYCSTGRLTTKQVMVDDYHMLRSDTMVMNSIENYANFLNTRVDFSRLSTEFKTDTITPKLIETSHIRLKAGPGSVVFVEDQVYLVDNKHGKKLIVQLQDTASDARIWFVVEFKI